MARYIDADRLINEFTSNGGIFVYGIDTVKAIISRVNVQPTADVVPVVRCKDCIHYKNEWCEILKAETPIADGFCCYGEREVENG